MELITAVAQLTPDWTKRLSAVRSIVAGHIIWAWLLTIPISSATSVVIYLSMKYFIIKLNRFSAVGYHNSNCNSQFLQLPLLKISR
jgi:hypothetical protein